MSLRIICFEDDKEDAKNLELSFKEKGYAVDFRHFDLKSNWDAAAERGEQIISFKPELAIVDLDDRTSKERNAGYRIIRKLKELQEPPSPKTKPFPVVAWSKHLKTSNRGGEQMRERASNYGAIPILKPRRKRYRVAEILRKAEISLKSSKQGVTKKASARD